jgi:septal ring factor EnvC (AmiA/AmiB activator)
MNPSELHTLFNAAEQTLLVATEPARLADLDEDQLDELLTRVRRARNKYSKLYRRQSGALVDASSSRAGTSTSNQRTRRKAEIFEDTLARVAKALSSAAKASAAELKAERLAAAAAAKGAPASTPAASRTRAASNAPTSGGRSAKGRSTTSGRRAAGSATDARRQSARDAR